MKVVSNSELHKNDEVVGRFTSPGYFRTLGARLREGRCFTEEDETMKLPVVVINQTMARLYFASGQAIGQQIKFWNMPPVRVAGVIDDIGKDLWRWRCGQRSTSRGVSVWDGSTLVAVTVVLGGAALMASAIPARRAASVDPMEALRAE